MRVKMGIKKLISILLVCVIMVANIQFLYAEQNDNETTKIESIEEINYESEDLATESQIEISDEKENEGNIIEEFEQEQEKEEVIENETEEKEMKATASEIDEIEKEEKEDEDESTNSETIDLEEEEQEKQKEIATSSEIENETISFVEEEIIVVEATKSELDKVIIEEQNIFAAPQEYILSPTWYDETAAGKAKSEITKIKISKSPETAPADSDASWNITGSNGLVAYIKGTEITIYAPNEGTIYMAEDSSYLFSGAGSGMYNKLEYIQNFNLLDTSRVKNMSSMFESAQSLLSIDLSNFDTSSVTNMANMFYFCRYLSAIDVSFFDTKEVTDFNHMFFMCMQPETIDVSSFDTGKCVNMSGMFNGCSNLKNLDLSHFNTSNVTDMSDMFNSCNNLTNIDLTSFDTKKVTKMTHMFYMLDKSKTNLEKIDLSSFDTSNVEEMAQMFYNCAKLTTIYASEKFVTTKLTQNMSDLFMFSDCTVLKGGNNTAYDVNHIDKLYARIDKAGAPGYFTEKNPPVTPDTPDTPDIPDTPDTPDTPEENKDKKEESQKDSPSGRSTSTGGSSRGATLPNNIRQNLNVTQQGTQSINRSSFGTFAAMNKTPITNLIASTIGNVAVFTTQNGEKLQGMQKVTVGGQDTIYYFNDDSTLYCGWMKDENNNYHYFNDDGKMLVNKTVRMNNQDYIINAQGELEQTNLDSLNKQTIFNQCRVQLYTGEAKKNDVTNTWSVEIINPVTGQKEAAKGMIKLVQDDGVNTYFFDNNGNLLTGWQFVDQRLLFFSPENGRLVDINN